MPADYGGLGLGYQHHCIAMEVQSHYSTCSRARDMLSSHAQAFSASLTHIRRL